MAEAVQRRLQRGQSDSLQSRGRSLQGGCEQEVIGRLPAPT